MDWGSFAWGMLAGIFLGYAMLISYKRNLYNKGIGKFPTREVLFGKLFHIVEDRVWNEKK